MKIKYGLFHLEFTVGLNEKHEWDNYGYLNYSFIKI